jgi:D-alanyl-D-alanine-carboxypeptidase/D-alanyl-D-alanine-endopeptidase
MTTCLHLRTPASATVTIAALLLFIGHVGCSGDPARTADSKLVTDAPGTDGPGQDAISPDGRADPWQAVTALLDAEVKDGKIQGGWVALDVYRGSDGALVYSRSFGGGGTKDRTTSIPIASASKWVTSTLILMLVEEGKLDLEQTTATWLGWTGVEGTITLRQLLTFTSGLREHLCTLSALTTLDACVAKIQEAGTENAPGAGFHYNSGHMAAAGLIAEKAGGKSWGDLFSERIVTPLGLSGETVYYTLPKQKVGKANPLLAGGIVTTMKDYGAFLTALQGIGTAKLLSAAFFAEQHKEQWAPGTTIIQTPNPKPKVHYGLGCWRECDTPDDVSACDADLMVHSAGAFGMVPWIDLKHGYYAVLGAEADSATSLAPKYNVPLVTDRLRALIITALSGGG